MRCLLTLALLFGIFRDASAETTADTVELAVNGPEGAQLYMDGQAMGKLPLQTNLVIRTGPHRFRLEKGKQVGETETLTLPPSGQIELNLTLSGSALIPVLRMTPGLLLLLSASTPAELTSRISEAVADAAKKQQAVLLNRNNKSVQSSKPQALTRCIESADCHEAQLSDGLASYALSLQIDGDSTNYRLRGALLDLRTRDFGANAEQTCASCDPTRLLSQIADLTAQLLRDTAARTRTNLTVSSTPIGARVLVDNRWLGQTPFTHEVFTGSHTVKVMQDGYLPFEQTIELDPNRESPVQAALQPVPKKEGSRPLWRLVAGGIAIGGGLLIVGFGASALSIDTQCKDMSLNQMTCSPYYDTKAVGGGLIGAGAALAITGAILIAIPGKTTQRSATARRSISLAFAAPSQ